MKTIYLGLLIAALGCGGSKTDWTSKKLVPQTVTLEGVSFTVNIPDGLPKDKTKPGYWDDVRPEGDHMPKVFTSINPLDIKSLDDAMRSATVGEANFVRKQERKDGFALTNVKGKHIVEAKTYTRIADKWVECTATQVGDGDLPNFDKTKAMLESICDSVAAK